jgi:uncharacterized protein (DUF2126 family)
MDHRMAIERIYESPRVTKPYTDEQWASIVSLGHAVDADLAAHDVRLTMGGEPTFVAADDPDAPEWNIEAQGPTKRLRAADLLWRLKEHFGANGFVHFGQGKQYPGEQLPRWSLGCLARRRGARCGGIVSVRRRRRPRWNTAADAERFIRCRCAPDVSAEPRAETQTSGYYRIYERRLPVNVDPFG